MSLLMNSIEASPNGGKITINVTQEINNIVILRITDEGIGISEKIYLIFLNHFIQQKKLLMVLVLGWQLLMELLRYHKGKIEVEKTSNQGTTFKVVLPLTEQLA